MAGSIDEAREWLRLAEEATKRQLADYTLDWPVSRAVAEARLREAEQFVAAVASMLNLQP